MIYLILIVLALLSAYREVGVLIDRGSWDKEVTWLKFWDVDWKSTWRVFDPHHFSYGLSILIFFLTIAYQPVNLSYPLISWLNSIAVAVTYWFIFFYVRNIGLHIIFMTNEYKRWVYLIPLIGGYFDK
ncbi:MAG: hypothetical protein IPJ03_22465 [Ignavibacteriales bacterium]|nr:hypothetical protein [Ignavibacteriales bacterium]